MNKYKVLLSILLKEMNLTPKELKDIIEKHNLDEHLEMPLRFFYKKVKNESKNI